MDPTKEQLEAMLADYVDGNLSGDELARAETFLDENPGVRAVMTRLMIDSEAIRSLPRVNAPHDLSEALRGQLEREMLLGDGTPVLRQRRLSTPVLAIAAMLVAGLGIGGIAYQLLLNRHEPTIVAANLPSAKPANRATASTSASDAPERSTIAIERESTTVGGVAERHASVGDAAADRALADRPAVDAAVGSAIASTPSMPGATPVAVPAPMLGALGSSLPAGAGAESVQVSPATLPGDVASWVAGQSASRSRAMLPAGANRAVVFVLDVEDAPGAQLADEAASFFAAGRHAAQVERVGTLRGKLEVADATAAKAAGSVEAPGTTMSNSAPQSPIGDAMSVAGGGVRSGPEVEEKRETAQSTARDADASIGLVATGVPEAIVAQWQAQMDASLGVGKTTAYEVPVVGFVPTSIRNINLSKSMPTELMPATTQSSETGDSRAPTTQTVNDGLRFGANAASVDTRDDTRDNPPADAAKDSQKPQQSAGESMSQAMQMQQISGVPAHAADAEPATMPSERRVDVYVVVRRSAPATSQPTTMP